MDSSANSFYNKFSNYQIYITRLPEYITKDELITEFNEFGEILGVLMKPGYAFIQFKKYEDAEDCIFQMDGKRMGGKRLIVQHACNLLFLLKIIIYSRRKTVTQWI